MRTSGDAERPAPLRLHQLLLLLLLLFLCLAVAASVAAGSTSQPLQHQQQRQVERKIPVGAGAHSSSLNFSFSDSWPASSIFLSGNGSLAADASALMLIPGFQHWSTMRATFPTRVQFLDTATRAETSFSTSFTFSIRVDDANYMGDGIAFFIGPSPYVPLHNEGAYLGLRDATAVDGDRGLYLVAVEFDTHSNPNVNDPPAHHVGLDVNGLVSLVTSRDVAPQLNLTLAYTDVHKMTAWIDYDARQHGLQVWLAPYPATRRDAVRVIAFQGLNLSAIVKPSSYVGFSAATGKATEENVVYSWSFQSWSSIDDFLTV